MVLSGLDLETLCAVFPGFDEEAIRSLSLLQTAGFTTLVAVPAVYLFRVQSLYGHIPAPEVISPFMVRKRIRTLGRWQR